MHKYYVSRPLCFFIHILAVIVLKSTFLPIIYSKTVRILLETVSEKTSLKGFSPLPFPPNSRRHC